jgi:hypothetical protein
MSVSLETSDYDLPVGALTFVALSDRRADTRSQLLMQLRERVEQGQASQQQWSRRFDLLYFEAQQSNWGEVFLIRWAAALLEKQRAALELLHPVIEQLQSRAEDYATRGDVELLDLCLATLDLIYGWISPYQKLCGQLLELAQERRSLPSGVLRARSVAGEIDHTELTREIIRRFPKILSELAK